MNLQEEARVARIQKYKEERRKQLTARTATLYSANVTERRQRKTADQTSPEDNAYPKSSSDLHLNVTSPSVLSSIRTTRTSRLRAAAANQSDSPSTPKRINRSSSVQSLEYAKSKNSKSSKLLDRDKVKSVTNRRQCVEKENLKNASMCSSDNDIGAIRSKPIHSINKNILEKDKSNLAHRLNSKNCDEKQNFKADSKEKRKTSLSEHKKLNGFNHESLPLLNGDDLLDEDVTGEDRFNSPQPEEYEDLFKNFIENRVRSCVEDHKGANENIVDDNLLLKNSQEVEVNIPVKGEAIAAVEDSVVPKVVGNNDGGLLGVCVPKVERFSELLSNLCSPCEADILFEDLLVENGIGGGKLLRKSTPECTAPCRRALVSPRTTSTPKRTLAPLVAEASDDGTVAKTRTRRSLEVPHPKTEPSLPSSKVSPKNTFNLPFGIKTSSLLTVSPSHKPNERRRSSEAGAKSTKSCIPLSKRSIDKSRSSTSPVKQDLTKDTSHSTERRKFDAPQVKSTCRSPEKAKSDTETRRYDRSRAQKDIENSEKYHYSKKRLISLENNSPKGKCNAKKDFSKNLKENSLKNSKSDATLAIPKNTMMSTLHETVRPHSSRLSQEMDSLAVLTKQTLDRVNKLSNNLTSNKLNIESPESRFNDTILALTTEQKNSTHTFNYGHEKPIVTRGVTERLRDIDTAAQRLIDFEKQSAMFSDLNIDTSSQNRRFDISSTSCHTPVSILKRKSIHEDSIVSNTPNQAIASPPVTFSPSVVESGPGHYRDNRRQGILKKRRSLDESQVARRSCSPEVSFADDGSLDTSKPILKNRRSSLEDIMRNRSPDGQIQGILKRKMSREEDPTNDDLSHGSPEPHGILKRKSNSSSSSSTTSSHVSIAQAVLLAAAGGAEIVDDDKETVRPILKKKSFSEERPYQEVVQSDTPKPILKKKSIEHEDYDFERPKKPILKSSKKLSGDEGHASSFDLSEDDRSSRRSSLLRSRTSDHSGSECEATVRPILKQRGSSLTRERSQSPRPRLSFCANTDANITVTNFSCDASDLLAAGPRRLLNLATDPEDHYPSAVLRRRNLRPKSNARSKSLACDVNNELLSILNNRRLKVEENCENRHCKESNGAKNIEETINKSKDKTFPSIADRIKNMEQALTKESSPKEQQSTCKGRSRDKERYKTQPITVEEMRSITSSLEHGQVSFQAFGPVACSFPSQPVEFGAAALPRALEAKGAERDPIPAFAKTLDSPPFGSNFIVKTPTVNGLLDGATVKDDSFGEATFLDFENVINPERRQSTLDEIEQEVNKVRVALDEDSRALDEDERQGEGDNWSLNVSCDSGVYNRASSRDSGPHSGEELGLVESHEIRENHATNSSCNEWSSSSIERGLLTMERARKSTESEALISPENESDDDSREPTGFNHGLVKSNSVVARASMWQQLQQQAKGSPKPLLRHSRSKAKEGLSIVDRFKTQPISFTPPTPTDTNEPPTEAFSLTPSKSAANVLDRDEDAKLDEDDPAKMSLMDKMKMFNTKLTHKPPVAGLPKAKEEKATRASRLKTMPVLASQVQEAIEQNERLTKSLTHEDVPRNPDFQLKMELFRSASAKNTSLEYIMRQNSKFRSLDYDDESPIEPAQRMITPEVRGILKSGTTVVPLKTKILAKGESSEGLKDEGIDSSSDESTSSVTSTEKSCSTDSSEEIPGPKPRRFQRKSNKLKNSRTDSDLTRLQDYNHDARKIQLPGAKELKERLVQAKNAEVKTPLLGKLGRRPSEEKHEDDTNRYRRFVKKLDEPIQLGKLRRSTEKVTQPVEDKPPPFLRISALNQAAKNKFFGVEQPQTKKDKSIEELTAAVRRYIPPVSKSMSTHTMEVAGSGSDGESSGGREVRRINTRGRHRFGEGVQRSATHAEMPHKGGTIADRLAALQAAGANDWRARVCRLSPEKEASDPLKAIERVKNQINENLNAAVDENKKVQIEDNELGSNILADRRNKLETAAQGWRKRVPQSDAPLFTVAGRLERDKVNVTPPLTPTPSSAPLTPASTPGVPAPNKFRSRKQISPTNGFALGPLRSASCVVVSEAAEPKKPARIDRESFKRSHSISESICQPDREEVSSPGAGAEKTGCPVRVPRADDETFQAFFAPVLQQEKPAADLDVDLDAIDSRSRQLLASDWTRRAKRERRHVASRNPLKALAARTDLKEEYVAPPSTIRELLIKEKVTADCGLAAEALAALASKEDFSNVALRSVTSVAPSQGTKAVMLMQVKGRRRVQTRLVEPVHSSVNRGDCFVLVTTDQVFVYIGYYANVIEKNRSTDIALHIHNTKDLGCKNSLGVITIDEHNKKYSNKHWHQFWSLLGVTEDIENYHPAETGHAEEDEIYESCVVQTNMCYDVQDDELVPIKEYWGQMPKIQMLNQTKTIVFDFGSEMYIWYGKNVPLESRRRAAQLAQEMFDEGYNYGECHINPLNAAAYQGARPEVSEVSSKTAKSRPEWTILSKVTQHMETILFKEKFIDWPDYTRVIRVKLQDNKTNSTEITPCDAEEMWSNEYQDPDLILDGSHVGRGTTYVNKESKRHYEIKTKSVCKWVVREYNYQAVENDAEIGEFFSGDSYIIRWEYHNTVSGRELNGKPSKHNVTGRDRCAYFCWQGKDAASNEKGAAALLTVELDKEKGPQLRVAQGNEPAAFLNLFQGNLVIHSGKRDVDQSRYRLFVTRGNLTNEAYLLQVPCSVRQLRSRGSLLLVDTEKGCLYIWHGVRSMKHTKNIAIELANKLIARKSTYLFGSKASDVKITEVKEGEEPKEVLEALGVANKQYYNSVLSGGSGGDVTSRLFHFTDLGGQFEANEVLSPLRHEHLVTPFPFEQKEMYSASQPALFLLDDGASVWLWQGWWPRGEDGELELADRNAGVGAFAAHWQSMRTAALRTAEAYWRVSRGSRPDVKVVAAGLEPQAFTDLFDTWAEHDEAAEANIAHGYKAGEVLSGTCELSRLTSCDAVLPLAALQRRPLPEHVDPHHLERHLTTPDFLEAFGMTKEDFSSLPAWKQTNMKKEVGLF